MTWESRLAAGGGGGGNSRLLPILILPRPPLRRRVSQFVFMVMPRPSSFGMQRLRRKLQHRKHKALGHTPPTTKKTAGPPPPPQPREGARERFQEPCPRHPREEVCASTSSLSRGTRPPPPRRPQPHASVSRSSAASASRAPPSRCGSSSLVQTTIAEGTSTAERLKPGTRALVRTRTQTKIDRRTTLVVWLGATVVSVTADGYEVIYEGNLPRDNPFATVHVPLHHVRAFNPSPPTPPAAAIKIVSPKNQTSEKSMRLIRDIAPETKKPAPRPTTAGKRIQVIRSLMSEKRQALDAYCLGY
ncbi:hypothetical protein QOZ80_7AG0567960 [Eleusine coracana subsp. coracana]|nr:hypothetical protein QOZ80_7AG0567960 [Eleusine coracana subsp. coracana]